MKTIHGRILGRTIQLEEDSGIEDGRQVEVTIKPTAAPADWGGGIRHSAGVAADEPEFDQVFQQIAQDRHKAAHRDVDL